MAHKVKLLFPSSSGGHLEELMRLKKLYSSYEYLFVTEDLPLNKVLLKNYNATFIRKNGKNRDFIFWLNFIINWFLATSIILRFKPSAIITTGSHTAIPFCYIGKLFGCKIIYILSFCRINSRARAADIIYPISDLFFVQWEQMHNKYTKGIYVGPIF